MPIRASVVLIRFHATRPMLLTTTTSGAKAGMTRGSEFSTTADCHTR